jgi:hypothetical protein
VKPLVVAATILGLAASWALAEEGTVEEKAEFPETEWEEMRAVMEKEGADAVIEFVAGFDDDEQRRQLYSLAQRGFAYRDWEGKNLDDLASVVQAGIAEGLRQAQTEADAAKAAKLLDYANVLSYNLAADLAECWPGDTLPRERRHFEAGLKAAADCLRWREELQKGPFPFSIAYWAHGMHLLSLGETHAALEDFRKSYNFAVEYAKAEGKDTSLSAEGEFGVLLAAGYVGLAEWVLGEETGKAHYEEAIAAFKEGAEKYPDKKDDFQFGIDQLEWVKGKFIK